MLVSKPDSENKQMSAAMVPLDGGTSGIGLPPRLQVLLEVLNVPSAATLRSRSSSSVSIPAVVGSAPTAAVKKADVDAFLASYANNVATLAAAWNAAMNAGSPGQGALHVVAG